MVKPGDGRRTNKAPRHVGVAPRTLFVLAQKPEAIPKLGQVLRTRMRDGKPSAAPQHPRRFGEVLWREDADDEIDGRVTHGPVGPKIGDREGGRWPTPRGLPRRILRDVEAQADNGAG